MPRPRKAPASLPFLDTSSKNPATPIIPQITKIQPEKVRNFIVPVVGISVAVGSIAVVLVGISVGIMGGSMVVSFWLSSRSIGHFRHPLRSDSTGCPALRSEKPLVCRCHQSSARSIESHHAIHAEGLPRIRSAVRRLPPQTSDPSGPNHRAAESRSREATGPAAWCRFSHGALMNSKRAEPSDLPRGSRAGLLSLPANNNIQW